jgi:hypoxanthine phosphoribosyltransferase
VLAALARSMVLVDRGAVARAIDQVAVRVAIDLLDHNPLVLAVMHGGLPFTAALIERLRCPLELGYLHVGRYGDRTRGSALRWHAVPEYALRDRSVLICDDVLDRGETLAALVDWAHGAGAREVRSAVLVEKNIDAPKPVAATYVALNCPDRYLFGCGMDYQGYWRNLPEIRALPEDLEHP